MAKKTKKSKKTLSVSFKGVEGKRKLPAEDDYKLEVDAVEIKEGDKGDYFAFTYKIDGGKFDGAMIYDNASTSDKSLWRLRSILECLGVEVDDEDEMDIDPEDLVGKTMMGVIVHEKDPDYGTKARLADFYAEGDEDGEEEEDEDDKKKSKKSKSKSKSKDEDEEGDEDEDDKKARRRKERRAARKGRKGDDDDGDSEEEEEETDKKKSKKDKGKKKAKKVSADDVQELDEDGLTELLEKHDLEDKVDLDDYKTLKKKQAAVIDALEDAELLESDD